MTKQFHKILNSMALSVAALFILLGLFHNEFIKLAATNYIINGIIIGTGLFGIGLCFYEMLCLLPEYKWLNDYIHGIRTKKLPPYILKPAALILQKRPCRIHADTLSSVMDMVADRFENNHQSIRYITSTLIFLGLFGTFWGLITTLGTFGELIYGLSPDAPDIMSSIQNGLSKPLSGMAIAFTSSLLGLGASLIMGFLSHMVGLAHNSIYTALGNYMAAHTHCIDCETTARILPNIDLNTQKITAALTNTANDK